MLPPDASRLNVARVSGRGGRSSGRGWARQPAALWRQLRRGAAQAHGHAAAAGSAAAGSAAAASAAAAELGHQSGGGAQTHQLPTHPQICRAPPGRSGLQAGEAGAGSAAQSGGQPAQGRGGTWSERHGSPAKPARSPADSCTGGWRPPAASAGAPPPSSSREAAPAAAIQPAVRAQGAAAAAAAGGSGTRLSVCCRPDAAAAVGRLQRAVAFIPGGGRERAKRVLPGGRGEASERLCDEMRNARVRAQRDRGISRREPSAPAWRGGGGSRLAASTPSASLALLCALRQPNKQ